MGKHSNRVPNQSDGPYGACVRDGKKTLNPASARSHPQSSIADSLTGTATGGRPFRGRDRFPHLPGYSKPRKKARTGDFVPRQPLNH